MLRSASIAAWRPSAPALILALLAFAVLASAAPLAQPPDTPGTDSPCYLAPGGGGCGVPAEAFGEDGNGLGLAGWLAAGVATKLAADLLSSNEMLWVPSL
mmetsp:Transcript_34473/g.77920  ORF Transcript_34473/g.77920 Transcript_34473/m.77920 type:complete len:100 (-) Transcript_34473:97-396(-)